MTYHTARDGNQLGTFGPDELRDGLATGRFLPTDLVWAEGMADWQPLSSLQLSSPVAPPAFAPPPVPAVQAMPMPAAAAPQYHPNAFPGTGEAGTCGQATASMILGLLSCALSCITAVPAIILGHMALGKIRRSGGTLTGRGLAITGLVLGYLQIAALPVMLGLAVPAFNQVMRKSEEMKHLQDGRMVILALKSYASDNSGKYPSSLDVLATDGHLYDVKALDPALPNGWKGERGWDYFGTTLSDSSPGDSVLISSRATGPKGERVVGLNDGSISVEKPKEATP